MVDIHSDTWKLVLILLLVGSTAATAQVVHRPIQDFLSTQIAAGSWYDSAHPYGPYVVIDFAGVTSNWLAVRGVDLGTTFQGDITERPLPDGRALIRVQLHGKNVYTRAFSYDQEDNVVLLLGASRANVLKGAVTGLGQMYFSIEFINDAMGAPIPSFFDLPADTPYQMAFRGTGPLHEGFGVPEGTPGFVQTTQIARFPKGNGVPGGNFFPAEHVNIGVIGN